MALEKLVGMYFLTKGDGGELKHWGQVVEHLIDQWFLITWCEYSGDGSYWMYHVVDIQYLQDFYLFDTELQLHEASHHIGRLRPLIFQSEVNRTQCLTIEKKEQDYVQ
jgi:hypothetical protein